MVFRRMIGEPQCYSALDGKLGGQKLRQPKMVQRLQWSNTLTCANDPNLSSLKGV